MDWDLLLEEARALTRDCTLLLPCQDPEQAVGFEGEDFFQGRNEDYRHQLTVRSGLIARLAGAGDTWTSLIALPDGEDQGVVLDWRFDPVGLPGDTRWLRSEPYPSLPPLEAIFRYGSERVGDWLGAVGWDREEPFSPDFPDELGERYDRHYLEQYPHGRDDVRAVLGGWHNFWPDGDWYLLCNYDFILSVRQPGGTWLELYARGEDWLIVPRLD